MTYTVTIKTEKGALIEEAHFDDEAAAMEHARFDGFSGPQPVIITVTDGDGEELIRRQYTGGFS